MRLPLALRVPAEAEDEDEDEEDEDEEGTAVVVVGVVFEGALGFALEPSRFTILIFVSSSYLF